VSESDCSGCLAFIENAWLRWDIGVFSSGLMDTHYHLALQTPSGNLQRVMRHIDGVYMHCVTASTTSGGDDEPNFCTKKDLPPRLP
jgi:hypothetical protein